VKRICPIHVEPVQCVHPKSENDILVDKREYLSFIEDMRKLRIEIIKAGKMEDIEII
jgi:hypothetical protein